MKLDVNRFYGEDKNIMDSLHINELLNWDDVLENGAEYKKELRIVEENLVDSTLDIWAKKDVAFPELEQYEMHNGYRIKFEFAFSCFVNPEFDLFHYTVVDIAVCEDIDNVNNNNIRDMYAKSMKIDTDSVFCLEC